MGGRRFHTSAYGSMYLDPDAMATERAKMWPERALKHAAPAPLRCHGDEIREHAQIGAPEGMLVRGGEKMIPGLAANARHSERMRRIREEQ